MDTDEFFAHHMTVRQREILEAVIEHGHLKIAAHALGISHGNVKVRLSGMLAVTGLGKTLQLAVAYVRWKDCK